MESNGRKKLEGRRDWEGKIMKLKESEKVELKKSTAELKDALIDLCAFANNGEGVIYFGISDRGKIIGQSVSDKTFKRVSTTILSLIEPRLYPNVYSKIEEDKEILIVELKNSAEKPYFYKGKAYKRIGTTNAYLSRYEIEKYLYERENPAYRFDKTIVKEYKEGVEKRNLRWFLRQAKEERNLPVNLSENTDVILKKLGLLTQNKLNFAGLLSFGKNIQQHFLNVIVKCALFEGKDKAGRILDHIEIKENVFKQIDFAENFILRNIRKSAQISSETGRRKEKYELPYLAIREAIANAVAHRDYRISSHIDIAIFDDRIEIWSPGELPLGIKLKDILIKRVSVLRNPGIAEVLFLAGYIERWGSGINKINQLMDEYGLPKPVYEETSGNFLVTFKRRELLSTEQVPSKYRASTEQLKILNFCKQPRARAQIQRHLKLKHREHFRAEILEPLVEKELIEMTIPAKPKSPKQKYIITEKGKSIIRGKKRG